MLKRIAILVLFLVILVAMLVFTKLNSGLIEIDLAFVTVASSIPFAFTVTFVMGGVEEKGGSHYKGGTWDPGRNHELVTRPYF